MEWKAKIKKIRCQQNLTGHLFRCFFLFYRNVFAAWTKYKYSDESQEQKNNGLVRQWSCYVYKLGKFVSKFRKRRNRKLNIKWIQSTDLANCIWWAKFNFLSKLYILIVLPSKSTVPDWSVSISAIISLSCSPVNWSSNAPRISRNDEIGMNPLPGTV